MSAIKQSFSDLESSIRERKAIKIGFKMGAEAVLKQFSPHAGRALQKGDGSIMRTYNKVRSAIRKF